MNVLLAGLLFWSKSEQIAKKIIKIYHFSLFPKDDKRYVRPEEVSWLLKQIFFIEQNDPKTLSYRVFEEVFLLKNGKRLLLLLKGIAYGYSGKKRLLFERKLDWINKQRKKIAKNKGISFGNPIPSLINGKELLGKSPAISGKKIGECLEKIREEQLRGIIKTKKQALKWLTDNV